MLRRRLRPLRIVAALVAALAALPVAAGRCAPGSRCAAMPCCRGARSARPAVRPPLPPCCDPISAGRLAARPAPPAIRALHLAAIAPPATTAAGAPPTARLPLPAAPRPTSRPLYARHCALLL